MRLDVYIPPGELGTELPGRVADVSPVMTTSNGTRAVLVVAERWTGPGHDSP